MTRRMLFSLAALTAAPLALAKPAPAPPPPPTMAADAPEQVRALQPLLGSWTGTGTLTMGDKSAPFTGTWDCTVASGGYGVRCQMEGTIEGMGQQSESDLFGWNAYDGLYHWFSVVNSGEVHDHYGSFDGNVMTFQQQGAREGHLFTERNILTFDGDAMTIESKVHVGNVLESTLVGTMTRK